MTAASSNSSSESSFNGFFGSIIPHDVQQSMIAHIRVRDLGKVGAVNHAGNQMLNRELLHIGRDVLSQLPGEQYAILKPLSTLIDHINRSASTHVEHTQEIQNIFRDLIGYELSGDMQVGELSPYLLKAAKAGLSVSEYVEALKKLAASEDAWPEYTQGPALLMHPHYQGLYQDKTALLVLLQQSQASKTDIQTHFDFKRVSPDLQKDPDIIRAALKVNIDNFQCLSDELKADRSFILEIVAQDAHCLRWVPNTLRNEKEFMKAVVTINGLGLEYANSTLVEDSSSYAKTPADSLALIAINQNPKVYAFAPQWDKTDRILLLQTVSRDGDMLEFANQEFKRDREVAKVAISSKASAFAFLDDSLKTDQELALLAFEKDPSCIKILDPSFLDNPEMMLRAVDIDPSLLALAGPTVKRNADVALRALQKSDQAYKDVDPSIQGDSKIAALYAQQLLLSDTFLPDDQVESLLKRFIDNPSFALAICKKYPLALQHAKAGPDGCCANREVVLTAIAHFQLKDDQLTRYVDPSLKSKPSEGVPSRELSLEAIRHNPDAFDLIDPSLKKDPQMVRAYHISLLKIDPSLFENCPSELKRDLEVVCGFVEANPGLMKLVDKDMSSHPKVIRAWRLGQLKRRLIGLKDLEPALQKDIEIVHQVLENNPLDLEFVHPSLRDNAYLVGGAVLLNPQALQFAGRSCRKHGEIIRIAIERDPSAFVFVDEAIRNDPKWLLDPQFKGQLTSAWGDDGLGYLGDGIKNNPDLIFNNLSQRDIFDMIRFFGQNVLNDARMRAIALNLTPNTPFGFFRSLGPDLKNDVSLVEKLMEINPEHTRQLIAYAGPKVKNDRNLMERVLEKDPGCMRFIGDELRKDRDFMLGLMQKDGLLLKEVRPPLSTDHDIVLAALQQNIEALFSIDPTLLASVDFMEKLERIVSQSLKENREFATKAFSNNGLTLEYFPFFQDDKDLVLIAVKNNKDAFRFASQKLQLDDEVRQAAGLMD